LGEKAQRVSPSICDREVAVNAPCVDESRVKELVDERYDLIDGNRAAPWRISRFAADVFVLDAAIPANGNAICNAAAETATTSSVGQVDFNFGEFAIVGNSGWRSGG
jgi:hypothetical protein